jgi:hypothetical protein
MHLRLPATNAIILFVFRPLLTSDRILEISTDIDCLSASVTGLPGRLFIENKKSLEAIKRFQDEWKARKMELDEELWVVFSYA